MLHVNPTFAIPFVPCTKRMRTASAPHKFAYTARAVRAKKKKHNTTKKYYENKAYMKHHPSHSLKNIIVFSALVNSKIVKVNLIF